MKALLYITLAVVFAVGIFCVYIIGGIDEFIDMLKKGKK